MIKLMTIFFALGLVCLLGCSDSGPSDGSTSPGPSNKTPVPNNVRIVVRWHGDDFASREDLETRRRIEVLIRERGVGKLIRSGTGMGWMDIVVEVEDREGATKAIKSIMEECAPGVKYTIEWVPSRGIG